MLIASPAKPNGSDAARGGTETRYWWGNAMKPGLADCKGCGDPVQPEKVGTRTANPYGLYDISGGLTEWVEDCWYRTTAVRQPMVHRVPAWIVASVSCAAVPGGTMRATCARQAAICMTRRCAIPPTESAWHARHNREGSQNADTAPNDLVASAGYIYRGLRRSDAFSQGRVSLHHLAG